MSCPAVGWVGLSAGAPGPHLRAVALPEVVAHGSLPLASVGSTQLQEGDLCPVSHFHPCLFCLVLLEASPQGVDTRRRAREGPLRILSSGSWRPTTESS